MRDVMRELRCIHWDVIRILRWISLKKIDFVQTGGCKMNFSIVAGTTGSFAAVFTPDNGAQAPGTVPQWTASDPAITLTPSADGTTCDVAVPAAQTNAFDLDLSAVSSDPSVGTVAAKHTIAVTQPVPPPAPLTAIDFAQTAG
jgi:hypothetical protein